MVNNSLYERAIEKAQKSVMSDDERINRAPTSEIQRVVNDSLTNTIQMELIQSAAKYIALGFVALSSTMFCAILRTISVYVFEGEYGSNVGIALQLADALINVITLYMTYAFGNESYHKVCGFLHILCIRRMTKETFRGMQLEFKKKREMHHNGVVSSSSS